MFCKKCGNELKDGQAFCTACGEKICDEKACGPAPSNEIHQVQLAVNYKKLGGYLLALVIMFFISGVNNLRKSFDYLFVIVFTGEILNLNYNNPLVVLILCLGGISIIIRAIGSILTAVFILNKKKIAIPVYAISKSIGFIIEIIAFFIVNTYPSSSKYSSLVDMFSVYNVFIFIIAICFFIINMIYFKKSLRVKEYFEK